MGVDASRAARAEELAVVVRLENASPNRRSPVNVYTAS
jgi:hypothetical protein